MSQSEHELLNKILNSYSKYYNIKTQDCSREFDAEAEFHSKNEQYFLLKSAKLSESESNEYVFFSIQSNLTEEKLNSLCKTAWEEGLSRFTVKPGHRNSDITLIIITDNTDTKTEKLARRISLYKSYLLTFRGWSNFSLALFNCSTGKVSVNRKGAHLKKLFTA